MKKFWQIVFNIFWVLCVGLESAIANAIAGVCYCVTIIGIPFGLQYFKFIPLVFAPAGKKVVLNYGSHPIMNTLWLLCGGLFAAIAYFISGGLLTITIIGYPLAKQLFKIALFNFAPFGCQIVSD